MREFATVAEIADEIRRRLGTRQAESATIGAAGGIQQVQYVKPELSPSVPPTEHDRKEYRPSDLWSFKGASYPPLPSIDYDKLHYTVGELLTVSENAFIAHFYRCLLKRELDSEGSAHYLGRWFSGDFITDIIRDISRAPEALGKGVRVSGLWKAALRSRLSTLPVVGHLFAIFADLIHLPEVARQFRALQRRSLPNKTSRLETSIEMLRAEVSALAARPNQGVPVELPDQTEIAAMWALLEQKVSGDDLNELLGDKVTQQELRLALESRSLEQLTKLEQSNEDRTEITAALLEQTRRIDDVEQRQADHHLFHEILLAQGIRLDTVEQNHQANLRQAHDALTEQNRRIDNIEKREERQREDLTAVRAYKLRILDIERRLGLVLEEARKRLPAPMEEQQIRTIAAHLDGIEAAQYTDFEDIFRGTRDDIKNRQAVYLPYFERVPRVGASFPILDIGCGRGEFLELLSENGREVTGVDANSCMIERCREFGLQVEHADAIDYLRSAKSGQYAVITAFHIVEHIPHPRLLSLLDEALRAMRPGGLLILETPNPQNLIVGASSFYIDPTHLNPIPPALLRFTVEARGFVNAEIKPMHPLPEYARPSGVEIPSYLAELLYGPQDYAVLAWKA